MSDCNVAIRRPAPTPLQGSAPPRARRTRTLDATRDLTCEAGWDQVSLSAVAARAEVSRPSVYKEFGNRAGLGRALVVRETQQFLAGVADALYPSVPDSHACLRAAILYVLQEADNQPLIRAVITAARKGSDSLLPYLTARADPIFDAGQTLVQDWLATRSGAGPRARRRRPVRRRWGPNLFPATATSPFVPADVAHAQVKAHAVVAVPASMTAYAHWLYGILRELDQ